MNRCIDENVDKYNCFENYLINHFGMEPIIMYNNKYSTLQFDGTIFADELMKNIVNLIIYLRVLFITMKQNYSYYDFITKFKVITNKIISKYDNSILLYLFTYLILSINDFERTKKVVASWGDNRRQLMKICKKAVCFFKLNCFYGDLNKYNELSEIFGIDTINGLKSYPNEVDSNDDKNGFIVSIVDLFSKNTI